MTNQNQNAQTTKPHIGKEAGHAIRMDFHIFIFWGQSHIGPPAGSHMDTTPKRKVGRPRVNPIRPPKKTAKLAAAIGNAERFIFSISPHLRSKLNRLAAHNQITEGEQLRRLIDQAVIPDQPETK